MSFETKSEAFPAATAAGPGQFAAPVVNDTSTGTGVEAGIVSPSRTMPDPDADTVAGTGPHLASPAAMSQVQACRIVRHLVDELLMLIGDRVQMRRDRRRALCHIRQIAMYVCHVSLGIPQSDIGEAFGRDRTTVGHACGVVEERRENAGFDDFVSTVERIANTVFGRSEVPRHD